MGWSKQAVIGLSTCAGLIAGTLACQAGQADVVNAAATQVKNGSYAVVATIRHDDESFEHFADRFEIVSPSGTVIATRVLVHPHIDEQPFTRALARVTIPDGITEIIVRANDKRHGLGGKEVTVKLPGR